MPSLRIDQSDLMCKNGCDYFGNIQWQGYCSKCHWEQLHRQRRAEKAEKASSATLPRPEQKKPDRGQKLATHSSFSKFEEKRLRQSETQKKANLLKFTVFKKSSTDEQEQSAERRPPQFKVPEQVHEQMKADFRARFAQLPQSAERDARRFVHGFITDVIHCSSVLTVDELSERVQRQYQRFMKYLESSPHYAGVDADTRERLVDFVETHAMSYLHDLPSVVFSPCGTDDERLDRAMSERVQQLGWVGERHLECRLDRASADCRQLLYKAINELLGMDRAAAPGGKLARVRRACRHVLALCGGARAPASADDLLPALIFTVLKANPPRLVSNINFVTRFCNAPRLMTGEAGYYFTNLCCAVSFIENLSAESLSMDKKEFDCYMAMPASIGGSAWAAALSLCGAAREADELRAQAERARADVAALSARAARLAAGAAEFEEEINKKVQDVLAKTPLEILPRRELPRLELPARLSAGQPPRGEVAAAAPPASLAPLVELSAAPSAPLVELSAAPPAPLVDLSPTPPAPLVDLSPAPQLDSLVTIVSEIEPAGDESTILSFESTESPRHQSEYHFDTPKLSPSKSPLPQRPWRLRPAGVEQPRTPSPSGCAPFARSVDDLLTPDAEQLAPGLGDINYDIDLSDFSGDNSLAEDAPKLKDFDPFAPQPSRAASSTILEAFDEFTLVDSKCTASDAFEVVHRSDDPFSPEVKDAFVPKIHERGDSFGFEIQRGFGSDAREPEQPSSAEPERPAAPPGAAPAAASLLDGGSSPTAACLLPSPLQPQTSEPS